MLKSAQAGAPARSAFPWTGVLVQLLLGGILGIKFGPGPARHAIVTVFNPLYFMAFFYPVYCMLTMDRAVEASRYRRMKTVLILFGSVHLLITLTLLMLLQAQDRARCDSPGAGDSFRRCA